MTDRTEDEVFMVSSDTESEYGDEDNIFYDEASSAKKEIKSRLKMFDADNGDLSNVYQERFLPKLRDRSLNFLKWLIDIDLLSSCVICPNAKNDPKCAENMEIVLAVGLYDMYQLRCKNCARKESIRKCSIFYGVKCNLRSIIRILYGWVKGVDVELMASMLGLDREIIGTLYNRAAKIAVACMCLCPGLAEVGGDCVVVLVDVYPDILQYTNSLKKPCTPILCLAEIKSMPQKYWLEPLPMWNRDDPKEVKKVRDQIVKVILAVVKPGSILVLPTKSSMQFDECFNVLLQSYLSIKYIDDLWKASSDERPLPSILDTIWKTPLSICEQAQYFNPDYVSQFVVKSIWQEMTAKDGFIMLITFIVYETRMRNIETYLKKDPFSVTDLAGVKT
ncbi:uncharacterized protein [Euwallacea similis]|uniref:uncharacterized protein n=1 Tax=Euwallacea similis TaxID=1736056 RepID=UPI003450C7E8